MDKRQMTNAEYHAHEGVSKSDLDLIHISPAHYIARRENDTQTSDLLFGSAFHKFALERDSFADEFAVAPVCDRRTKEGKAVYAEFTAQAQGKSVITPEQMNTIVYMCEEVFRHPIASKLLSGGAAEQSVFWDECGTICKCRPDYLKDNYCIDLKTTRSAKPGEFMKSAYNYRYHVQAAWYLRGLEAAGADAREFIFIAVEKEPPYAVCVYLAGEDMLSLGADEAEKDLTVYKNCVQTRNWYAYDEKPTLHELMLPAWARKEIYGDE